MLLRQLSFALRRRFFIHICWLVWCGLFWVFFSPSFKKYLYRDVYFSRVVYGVPLHRVRSQAKHLGETSKFPLFPGAGLSPPRRGPPAVLP